MFLLSMNMSVELDCDLNRRHQHPPCVRSRTHPVQPDRPTGSPPGLCSSARPGGLVLCLEGRSHPVPSHWGRNHSRAGRIPRRPPAGPTGRHTPCPTSHPSTAPPVQHSGLNLPPAAQPGFLRTLWWCQSMCLWWQAGIRITEERHSYQTLQIGNFSIILDFLL